ncbi:putative ubiquitin-conjugating enzyme E2 25 [Iris pallida]|uniref:E2 ubiquitin-conjugating enzyme n=1 Tax=Iris pallida TaxID=29817 RepID=A0AAX6HXE6_IRIPA|nr:putative ubiquitin-conjugating enzyme E2 25 [Iris pallida]
MGPSATKKQLTLVESSSADDPEVVIGASSSSSFSSTYDRNKRQRSIDLNLHEDDEPDSAMMIIGENTIDYKNKKPAVYDRDWQSQAQEALSSDLMKSSTSSGSQTGAADDACKSLEPDAMDYTSYNSDECDYYDEDEDEYVYDTDMIDIDCSYNLAAKFDDLDLPPGVEATVPWLQKPVPEKASNHTPLEVEIDERFNSFKQFDTVEDYSDHHFAIAPKEGKKPPKEWMKKIQQEWKLLENDLPETIFVRVYEERMDLLRAVIIGPAGTPYHDGLFFFDFHFPTDYPYSPPRAHYHSGGLRLNPNLYACGKVCLSLLNTWSGSGCERWNPVKSTMLQVLVSIQALVLNEKPYFNEPGYERTAKSESGQKHALMYNENTFLYSCKTMLYSLRRPPKYFEDFVAGHFRKRGHTILLASRAYLDKVQIGSDLEKAQNANGGEGCSNNFKAELKKLFEDLLMEFTVKGADCKEFLCQKAKVGDATALPKPEGSTLEQ